jgi:hypothetical protein
MASPALDNFLFLLGQDSLHYPQPPIYDLDLYAHALPAPAEQDGLARSREGSQAKRPALGDDLLPAYMWEGSSPGSDDHHTPPTPSFSFAPAPGVRGSKRPNPFTATSTYPSPPTAYPSPALGRHDSTGSSNSFKRQRLQPTPQMTPQMTPPPSTRCVQEPFGAAPFGATLDDLTDDQRLLIELRENHPASASWKETMQEFNLRAKKGPLRIPALQMRYKRLKERLRRWTDAEVSLPRRVRPD